MTDKRTEIGKIGEFGLIQLLAKEFSFHQPSTLKGIGDDAAVMRYGDEETVVSTDLLIEGIHFDLSYSPLKHLGYKAVVVNLSDIYAMRAIPRQITFSMALSNRFAVEAVEELYSGVKLACDRYQVDLVGGDTTSSKQGLCLSVTAIGTAKDSDMCYRSGAQVGDLIGVTGDLGAAYLGLQILEREKQLFLNDPNIQPDLENQKYLIERELKPEAQKEFVELLYKRDLKPTAMQDISDGLASDLMHICKASNVGAIIEEAQVPITTEAQMKAIEFRLDPITCALNGGEDYELLFTFPASDLPDYRLLPGVSIIGEIVESEQKVKLHTKGGNIHDVKAQGWMHF